MAALARILAIVMAGGQGSGFNRSPATEPSRPCPSAAAIASSTLF